MRPAFPASIAISTYLKSGFTPSAMAADSQGDSYLAGNAVIDSASGETSALMVKVDPKVTQYLISRFPR